MPNISDFGKQIFDKLNRDSHSTATPTAKGAAEAYKTGSQIFLLENSGSVKSKVKDYLF